MFSEPTSRNPIGATLLMVVPLLCLCFSGCGEGRRPNSPPGGPGSGEEPTAAELTALGWLSFENGSFLDAETNFHSALGADSTYAEAYNGAGWSSMNLGRLSEAKSAFEAALAGSLETADPHAGIAVLLRDLEPVDFSAAIYSARDALAIEPRYIFDHDDSFDWSDLRLIIGQAAWEIGSYGTANDQIDSLGGIVQDEDSPTFVEDLLGELERLGSEGGGNRER